MEEVTKVVKGLLEVHRCHVPPKPWPLRLTQLPQVQTVRCIVQQYVP
jgi:hypothetical protein